MALSAASKGKRAPNLDQLKGSWFSEEEPGIAFSLEAKKVLHQEKSKYQDILIYDSETFGRVLMLDRVFQCTSRDEFAYQEMIAHVSLFSHPCPKSVLVVGGGDGGVLREVVKHPMVEEVCLCEIDERVVELSKEYLKHMSVGFDSPKVKVYIQDGVEFMKRKKEQFDVIITDSSDPIGPGVVLFENAYFSSVKDALKPGGIMCMQGECMWLDLNLIHRVMKDCQQLFPVVRYASISIPTYISGQIGLIVASKNKDTVFEDPIRIISSDEVDAWNLRYYDSQVHRSAFVLPRFVRKGIQQ